MTEPFSPSADGRERPWLTEAARTVHRWAPAEVGRVAEARTIRGPPRDRESG